MKSKPWYAIAIGISLIVMGALNGCSSKGNSKDSESGVTNSPKPEETRQVEQIVGSSTLDSKEDQVKLAEIMEQSSLSNVDTFFEWVKAYQERKNETTDGNSRMSAFLLLQNQIELDPKAEVSDTMQEEIAQIEKEEQFSVIREQIDKYKALFSEVSIATAKGNEDYEQAYPIAWEERGISFPQGRVSLISVVVTDSNEKVERIAHAGVLLDLSEGLLFIEKLAPREDYQITRFDNRGELMRELLGNRNYAVENENYEPFLLENDQILLAK